MTPTNAPSFGGRKEDKMKKINGIIVAGKVYELFPEVREQSCDGCSLFGAKSCNMNDYCTEKHCIFRYSQELTDIINEQ